MWNCKFKVQKNNVRKKRSSIVSSKRKSSVAHKRKLISRYSTSGTKEKGEKYERENKTEYGKYTERGKSHWRV